MSIEQIPTALERKIEIRTDFDRESKTFGQTDGVMREIALGRCNQLLDEYNKLAELIPVQPTDNGEAV